MKTKSLCGHVFTKEIIGHSGKEPLLKMRSQWKNTNHVSKPTPSRRGRTPDHWKIGSPTTGCKRIILNSL